MPGLIYATHSDTLFVNIYASNKADVQIQNTHISIAQQTEYPLSGIIKISVNPKSELNLLKVTNSGLGTQSSNSRQFVHLC
jgi:DUF1680 family protein